MAAPVHRSLPAQERPPGLDLADALAVMTRSLGFYPEANSRVQACVDRVQRTLAAACGARENGGADDELSLVFSRDALAVEDERHPLSQHPNVSWLSERFDTCGLAGVALHPTLDRAGLLRFGRQLLDAYRRSALDEEFEQDLADPPPGVRLLPRRFEGTFDAAHDDEADALRAHVAMDEQALRHREDQLAARLLRHPAVFERIERLADEVVEREGEGRSVSGVELLSRIVRTLPMEALRDGEVAVARTLEVLDLIDAQWVRQDEGDDPLGRALLTAGLQLFGQRNTAVGGSAGTEAVAPGPDEGGATTPLEKTAVHPQRVLIAPGARGHAQDERITDDLQALLEEVQALPPASASDLKLLRAEALGEQIGVYLHYLITLDAEEEVELVHEPLSRILRTSGVEERQVVGRYIEVLRPDSKVRATPLHRRRLLDFLHAYGLTRLLADYGAFSADMALELFPEDFGLYLDSIDLLDPKAQAELARLLAQLGTERVLQASSQIVREARVLEPLRARRLLARPDPALVPIALIALARGDSSLKPVIADFVRGLVPESEETCLLQLLGDDELPRDYLADLLDPPGSAAGRMRLHERISQTLCQFIDSVAKSPTQAGRRLAAVRLLALFQSPEATALLRRLAHGRRMLLLPCEPTEVREAARASLACHV